MKKKILIIGANSPSAIETASIFLKKKYEVHLLSKKNLLVENKSSLTKGHIFYKLNLNSKKEINDLFNKFSRKNIIFNSLVFFQRYRGKKDSIDKEINVSIKATIEIIKLFSHVQINNVQRSIVILSSVASEKIAQEQGVAYHLSKASLDQLVRYYAIKLGNKNIRVNGIQPALVFKERVKDYCEVSDKLFDLYKKIVPLGRMGTTKDIAKLAFFLSSDESSYITGQIIKIDGGLSLHENSSLGLIANIQNYN